MSKDIDLKKHIRSIPDFPKPGILFYDISTLLAHPKAWHTAIERLADLIRPHKPDVLAGIESRGFLLAAPLALIHGLVLLLWWLIAGVSIVVLVVRRGHPERARISLAGGAIVGMAFYCSPYALYLAGAWPDPGSTASTGLLYAFLICANTASVVSIISATSMVAGPPVQPKPSASRKAAGSAPPPTPR